MTEINSTKVIVIVGPTASGKSDLAIKLAKKIEGEIISADSRQVYRGMDIGTGKVSKKEQKIVPHRLIDIVSPKKQFTADDFKKLGEKAIKEIFAKGKIPVIVGGTGFYVDVLLGRISVAEVPPNKKLRAKLEKQSAEQLFKRLEKLDPNRAKTIEPQNKRRLIRALEIAVAVKKSPKPTLTSKNAVAENEVNYKILWIGIKFQQKDLNKRIKKRLNKRLKQGVVREVKNLLRSSVTKKRLYDFGLEYRWVSRWLKSSERKQSFSNSQEYENLLRDIIKYSKRQMTWFKRNKEIHWLNPSADGQREAEKLFIQFLR